MPTLETNCSLDRQRHSYPQMVSSNFDNDIKTMAPTRCSGQWTNSKIFFPNSVLLYYKQQVTTVLSLERKQPRQGCRQSHPHLVCCCCSVCSVAREPCLESIYSLFIESHTLSPLITEPQY